MNPDNNKPEHRDLGGAISLELKEGKTFDQLCAQLIKDFNPARFEALAVRLYWGKELTVTIYAIDKSKQEDSNYNPGKLPVKKFKLGSVSVNDILPYISEVNFTLTTGNYNIEDMEVINK